MFCGVKIKGERKSLEGGKLGLGGLIWMGKSTVNHCGIWRRK